MKKSLKTGFVALSLAALTAFTACSAVTPVITPYWYGNSFTGMENTAEKLTYKVTHADNKEIEITNSAYAVEYGEGKYTVTFENTTFDAEALALGNAPTKYNGRSVYRLETELTIPVKYVRTNTSTSPTTKEESEEFTDTVRSVCYFLSAADSLAPVYSQRSVISTSPAKEKPTSLEECYTKYSYRTICDYGSKTYSYEDAIDSSRDKTGKIDIPSSGLFLDNEQLFLLGRGLPLTSSTSVQVFSPYLGKNETVILSAATQITYEENKGYEFRNTDKGENVTANASKRISLYSKGLTISNPMTVFYATRNETENHRNVMLALFSPLPYGLGGLKYTLLEADFCDR